MQEIMLVEQKELREQMIGRVEILDKVKELFLIPKLEAMTFRELASYFVTPIKTIKSCYKYNRDEIDQDGAIIKTAKDFLKIEHQSLEITQGKTVFRISDNVTIEVPNRGVRVFPKRAILRIAMLLRDSKVAKEIRTQLLNAFDKSTTKQRTADIDKETALMLEIGRASMTGDMQQINLAYANAFAFKNRHIKSLEESNQELADNNKALAGDILQWSDRACLNKAIRLVATVSKVPFGCVWNTLYDELRYKHGIGLSQRGDSPYIQHIKESEWSAVQQSLSAICEGSNISISWIMQRARMK